MNGYQGKLLRINLTDGSIKVEELNREYAKAFIGGRGLGTKMAYEELDPTMDALSPENKLYFMTGPFTGTPTPTGGRYMVITKAPLTGTIGSSNSGGYWGAELKFAGWDGVIVEGKSEKPVYICIEDDKVEICDAEGIWGQEVPETEALLKKVVPEKSKIVSIGPGGEKLSLMAAIMNDTDRAAGRSGVGAVMGSKNLKAITVRGTQKTPLFNSEKLKEVVKENNNIIIKNGVTGTGLPTYGSAILVNIINEGGILPTDNFQKSFFANADAISGEHMTEHYLIRKNPCYRCPIGCGRYVKLGDKEGGGPEYETIWAFGSDCGIDDFEAILEANFICNELGIDTITAGATLAAAMELYQKGYITDEDLGGEPLEFGNKESIINWTRKMGLREGFGDKLADGSYRLCESYGVPELSMTVKKQELPAYDPRGVQGQALSYATSNRGGCHVRGYMISPEVLGAPEKLDRFTTENKALWTKIFQDLTAFIDSAGLCLFTSFALGAPEYRAMLNEITGYNFTDEDVLKAGERIYNLERMFNEKAGITAETDTLPPRLIKDGIPEGPSKGEVARLDITLPEYYELRGWQGGVVSEAKKAELGLN
ncbi:MAG: aldehyde ferredoxin oxidoreductase family protein [Clostridiaceae bacterium]